MKYFSCHLECDIEKEDLRDTLEVLARVHANRWDVMVNKREAQSTAQASVWSITQKIKLTVKTPQEPGRFMNCRCIQGGTHSGH